MYAILQWIKEGEPGEEDYVTPIVNENGSIKLFVTVEEADAFADAIAKKAMDPEGKRNEGLRVISIEGVPE
jgi:hypothetical protein